MSGRSKASSNLDDIYERDNHTCWICGKFCQRQDATRDHVIPHSFGGPNGHSNIKIAHSYCNNRRGNRVLVREDEKLTILLKCQGGVCHTCRNELTIESGIESLQYRNGSKRLVMLIVCREKCMPFIPSQRVSV